MGLGDAEELEDEDECEYTPVGLAMGMDDEEELEDCWILLFLR